mmetsp:Transcript_9488/g.15970  ORF Transcript_9488/g.15970 Transcript_9488/m.15970 type:complete len:94 (-) Transcript_9488:2104-2385(-)
MSIQQSSAQNHSLLQPAPVSLSQEREQEFAQTTTQSSQFNTVMAAVGSSPLTSQQFRHQQVSNNNQTSANERQTTHNQAVQQVNNQQNSETNN